jgi:vitamin B12 transporter
LAGKFTNDLQLTAGTTYGQGRNSLETATGSSDFSNQISSLKLEQKVSNQWTHSVNFGYAFNSMDVAGGYTPGKLETNRRSVSWINNFSLAGGVMTLGLDRWLDRAIKTDYANSASSLDNNLSTTGLFTQYAFNALGLDWQAAVRGDKHSVYGSQTTYNAAVGKKLASGWSWNASHGTAFKAPTTNDLFWPHSSYPNSDWSSGDLLTYPGTCGPILETPCSVDESGNSGVKPETSKTTELSLRYQGDTSFAINLYETRINDLIQWDTRFAGVGSDYTQYWYPNNVKEALMRGLEISFNKKIHAWSFDGQYTRLLATDVSRAEQLDRRPKNSASVGVSHRRADLTMGIELVMAADRLDNSATSSLAGYGVVNLKSTYVLNRDWAVQARVENILDKSYTLATYAGNNYATPGPSGYLTLRYAPH